MEGATLRLRLMQPSDRSALAEAASDPEIWLQHPDRERWRPERFAPYFESGLASAGAFVVEEREGGRIVGSSRFVEPDRSDSSVEIGYTFLIRRLWGGDANREIKTLMLDRAFERVERVWFLVGSGNLRSQAALAKIGAAKAPWPPTRAEDREARSVAYVIERASWLRRAPDANGSRRR